MANILFIKTSSLGDVIHHMPALTDARRALPDARFAWVVEEAYAPLVRLHPAVNDVIPVASRHWRGHLAKAATWRAMRAFARQLRATRYDEVVDTQGLMRSGLIARLARGHRHGYDAQSIRESWASSFYHVRHRISRELHAVTRNRMLAGLALGYAPQEPLDYGLDRKALTAPAVQPYGIFFHGTAQQRKEWPEENWVELGNALGPSVSEVLLPWGTEKEYQRSERIAARVKNARVPDRMPLDDMARLIAGASFVIGVDTGLLHLAAALSVPLTAIFIASEPLLTGPVGSGPIAIVGGRGDVPAVRDVAHALERLV